MDRKEKEYGSKKSKPVEVVLNSEDDEPIGSLFNFKRARNNKKLKSGLEGEEIVKVETRAEKFFDKDNGMGEMDDTLASFKKKLKAPKKNIGLGSVTVRNSDLSLVGNLHQSLSVSVKDGSEINLEKGPEEQPKQKLKWSKICSMRKKARDTCTVDDDKDFERSRANSLESQKQGLFEQKEESKCSSDENLEDSLSVFVQKAQSSLIKRISSKPKQAREPQASKTASCQMDDGIKESSSFHVPIQGLSPVQVIADEVMISSGKRHVESCKATDLVDVVEIPSSTSCLSKLDNVHEVVVSGSNKVVNDPLDKQSEGFSITHQLNKEEAVGFDQHLEHPLRREESCSIIDDQNQEFDSKVMEAGIDSVVFRNKDVSISDDRLSSLFSHLNQLEGTLKKNEVIDQSELFEYQNDSCPEESKLLVLQRRKPKRRKHGDMAYEGDADWDVLLDEHGIVDTNRPIRTRERSNFKMGVNAEIGGAAAVSSGLKARGTGPVEKIKFKEVLKRKGGLQEYLECRNQILGLWSKDVSRILPLADCGVADIPGDDSPRASLIREIYSFLDHYGYINVGIVSEKEKAEPSSKHNYRLLQENFVGNLGTPVADSEDGVSFILGKVNDETRTEPEESKVDDEEENGSVDPKATNKMVHLDISNNDPSIELGICPVISKDPMNKSDGSVKAKDHSNCDMEAKKRIIVIGAGPAGLTAARHLARQGMSVTVLEARDRIGGRVYTDRSSLSVPVDLGASIITGVEADVATERRPDPSSLICAQLGLELTVLNSDCPLYDIVTGQKVPSDLDEALEAEYNGLLDDMVLLVAHKGEQAMRMSLEDGLEYALKRRRVAESKTEETELSESNGYKEEILSPLERRVMDWHFAHLEYGCAALLKEVSLPYWNQDDVYGGFGGAHCMIKAGYSTVVESLAEGLQIHFNHIVTDVSYSPNDSFKSSRVKVSTSNGGEFIGDAVLITVPLGCLKAETIKFSPSLPEWKYSSIQRLGFGVLNKVVLEFEVSFWDDSVDYFGATAEETNQRGHCFMFWNVKKTVGAPVLIALVVGKAAIDGENMTKYDHVNHALKVLRRLYGESSVPEPVASVVTDWGKDPFAYGAYSYVAIGASGEDYDILGRPIENCLFFAGEATCKEHPDTVGGAMMSGMREAVRIIEILETGNDFTSELEAMEAERRHSDSERNEVRDIIKRLEAIQLSNVLYKNSLSGAEIMTKEALLEDMFFSAKTTAGRLHLAKELLSIPVGALKAFAGTKEGLGILNSWILDSMGKDGTQLLRHCVRLLVLVSTDLLAVRLSGIGKTVKEKVCVHTSRDIRAIASQLVSMWIEVFRKEKASNGGLKLLRQMTAVDSSKSNNRSLRESSSTGKPPLRHHQVEGDSIKGSHSSFSNANTFKKLNIRQNVKLETVSDLKSDFNNSSISVETEDEKNYIMSEEEVAAFAAAEAARAAALAAAKALEDKCNTVQQLPKIPSFHKFARREQYEQVDDFDLRRKWPSGGIFGRQDCISEIDSRNCRVRNWSVDFSATCANLNSSKMSVDNRSQRTHSNELALGEQSGESTAVESSIFTKAWVDSAGSVGIKDYHAIDRWQSQAEAADSSFYNLNIHLRDTEDSNAQSNPTSKHDRVANESSISQVSINKEMSNQPRGSERIKQALIDYVASLLMPLYKARKIDKEGYKYIMKKSTTKVMEQVTDAEKAMTVSQFLDFKRKNKIRAFVDKLIERHMTARPVGQTS